MAALDHKISIMLGSMIESSKMPLLIPDTCALTPGDTGIRSQVWRY